MSKTNSIYRTLNKILAKMNVATDTYEIDTIFLVKEEDSTKLVCVDELLDFIESCYEDI